MKLIENQVGDASFEPGLAADAARLELLASGRRIVNLCLLSWLAAGAFQILTTPVASLFILGSILAACIGVHRLSVGLTLSLPKRGLLLVAMLVPVVDWVVMALLGMRAAKVLRTSGYQVGLLESRKATVA